MHFTSALCHPPLCSHTIFKETSILPYVKNVFIVSQLISLYDVNTQLLHWIIECVMYRVNWRLFIYISRHSRYIILCMHQTVIGLCYVWNIDLLKCHKDKKIWYGIRVGVYDVEIPIKIFARTQVISYKVDLKIHFILKFAYHSKKTNPHKLRPF